MTWLLDSSILVAAIRGNAATMVRIRATPPSAIVISPISVTELRFGAAKRMEPAVDDALDRFLGDLHVAPLAAEAADRAGRLMAERQRQGRPLHLADAIIAAQALIGGHVLVTHDRDFHGIKDLLTEDWAAG